MRWLLPIYCPPTNTYGSLTRVIAVAHEALSAGHEVRFCASGEQAEALQQHGFFVYQMPAPTMLGLPGPLSNLISRAAPNLAPPVRSGRSVGDIWTILFFTGYGKEDFLRRCLAAQLAVVNDYQPDVLFTDIDLCAFLLAAITDLPLACTHQDIMRREAVAFPLGRLNRAAGNILASHGRPAQTMADLYFGPRTLKVVPSIPALDGADPNRPDVFYAGHLFGDLRPQQTEAAVAAPTGRDDSPSSARNNQSATRNTSGRFIEEEGQRYVFAYVGTGSIPFGQLSRVLPDVFSAGDGLICKVGAQHVKQTYRQGNVVFEPFVDAVSLLPHCDWVICHGGQNTIVQALSNGVPLIVLPGAIFERRFNAEQVAAAGAGIMGERNEFNAAWLRDVLNRRDEFAPQAAALGAQIKAYGGPAGAVTATEKWAGA